MAQAQPKLPERRRAERLEARVTAEQKALIAATGYASWDDLRAAFRARITESVARIRTVKSTLGRSTTFMKKGAARDASADLVDEYHQLAN